VLLNRPEQLNALSGELMDELVAALQRARRDDAVRCIVLGGGERAFAAGADIGELAAATPIELYESRRIDAGTRSARCGRRSSPPSRATASAAAASSRCSCDLIVASETARSGSRRSTSASSPAPAARSG
jgi:enoyl-CoA hydratase